jgi:hypothetical protein
MRLVSTSTPAQLDFARLTHMTGGIEIRYHSLTIFKAPMLTSVFSNIHFEANQALTWIDLSSLQQTTGHIYVLANKITRLSFPSLVTDGGALAISDNNLLTSVNLPQLKSIGIDFEIARNAVLISVNNPALLSVGDAVIVCENFWGNILSNVNFFRGCVAGEIGDMTCSVEAPC